MADNSLNLMDLIRSYLTSDFTNNISSLLQESRVETQTGISAAVPRLLAVLTEAASTPDGARRLAAAVDDADENVLSNVGTVSTRSSLSDEGSKTLQSILGVGSLSELTGNVARTSGLSGKAVAMLIGCIAPIVLGVLKKVTQSRNLDAAGLSRLLSSQSGIYTAAIPEEMRDIAEEKYGGPRPVSRAAGTDTHSSAERETPASSLNWILPLLLLAGLLGLIWRWGSRHPVSAARDSSSVVQQTYRNEDMLFRALTTKYQSVIQEAQSQGVQISNLTSQDGTLVIQGTAPSLEAANKVWDEIKRVDPRMQDIVANFTVDSSSESPISSKADVTQENTHAYTVKSGDTLSMISKRFYGNANEYMRIFNANRNQLKQPDTLEVGQQLEIPMQ